MKINILLFGILADSAGVEKIELLNIRNTEELINTLQNKYPQIINQTYRIAINKEITESKATLKDGDEVALLPPFAGG